ncbi:MAG: hypothetical protein OXE77_11905 [Flavobacteriaceae bacterium]|nr:hypothetical protein [Flavobacteriaceae bacterium]MCY4266767.1 hypothetical protein [Flavobacteriaceae bacterium]
MSNLTKTIDTYNRETIIETIENSLKYLPTVIMNGEMEWDNWDDMGIDQMSPFDPSMLDKSHQFYGSCVYHLKEPGDEFAYHIYAVFFNQGELNLEMSVELSTEYTDIAVDKYLNHLQSENRRLRNY